jgi:hypothetical protein
LTHTLDRRKSWENAMGAKYRKYLGESLVFEHVGCQRGLSTWPWRRGCGMSCTA